ncbi:MAG: caspase family protein [Planctomycetes bacterium]|nr:caspase family protein [Planctomycetota bacterium]
MLLLTLLSVFVLGQEPQADAPRGQRRALLIGINDYVNPDIPDLRGCVNDVALIEHVLERRYGFEEVRVLRDREATRAAILRELQRVVDATDRDDFLFVHYSGHGSQQQDQSGDEAQDGLDETLVACDSRSGDVPDILDDEIDAILSGLRTSNAVISFDACHSGTGTRALSELRTRDVPPDPRAALYRRGDDVGTRGGAARYLAITSALARERALDGPVDGTAHGLFSLALGRVLAEQPLPGEGARRRASVAECERMVIAGYRDIVDALGCTHRASTPAFELIGFDDDVAGQRRRLEGALLPAPRPGRGARFPWLAVQGDGKTWFLEGADARGVTPGSCWAIFAPGEASFERGALAWGEVGAVRGGRAALTLRGGADLQRSFADCRAVRIAPARDAGAPRVRLELAGDDRARARDLLARLSPRAAVVADDAAGANFIFRRLDAGSGFVVLAGDETSAVAERATLDEAARVVARTLTASRLLALDNPTSSMRVRVCTDLVGGEVEDREIGVLRARRKPAADGYRVYRDGDPVEARNCLQVHVEADQDCYVTVVDVDAQGRVGLLFPNELSEESGWLPQGLVPAGLRVSIPDAVREDNAAGFLLPFLTAGSETIRVFATSDAATAERIRDAVRQAHRLQKEAPDDAAAVEDVLGALREELMRATFGLREIGVMGVGVVPNKPRRQPAEASATADEPAAAAGDWTAASINFRVAEHEER